MRPARLIAMRFGCVILLQIFSIIWIPTASTASENVTPLVLRPETESYPLGLQLSLLEDAAKAWTVEQVASPAFSQRFVQSRTLTPNFGYAASAYWVRFSIDVSQLDSTSAAWVLESRTVHARRLDLYVPRADGGFTASRTGTEFSGGGNRKPYRYPSFPLSLHQPAPAASTILTFYLRYETDTPFIIPLVLWQAETFAVQDRHELFIFGLYFGIAVAITLYSMFLYLSLRDKTYLYYLLNISCFAGALFFHNGVATEFLPSGVAAWMLRGPFIYILYISAMFALEFIRKLLNTKFYAPRLHPWLMAMRWVIVATSLLSLVLPRSFMFQSVPILTLFIAVLAIVCGAACLRKGYQPARYFLIAWTAFLVGGILYQLRNMGFLPTNDFTEYSYQYGSAIEMILLSLALADRIHLLRREKEHAESEALRSEIYRLRTVELGDALHATELQSAEAERQRAEAERQKEIAQKANLFKTELLSIAAHDLKNPLQSVLGFAELLREKYPGLETEPESAAWFGSLISQASRRMLRLINDLLTTAATETYQLSLTKTAVDLSKLAESVVDHNRHQAGRKSQRLVFTASAGCTVMVDEERIKECIDNLISNAIKYSPRGAAIHVEVGLLHDAPALQSDTGNGLASLVRVAVRDEGQGMSEEDLKKVFGKFQRLSARPSGGESSTGLGLSIVKQLIELHGGMVFAASEGSGKGSTFAIELPLAVATMQPAQNAEAKIQE
ncbi:MAG: sensor histidine kinase [Rhizobacter sp.]|nr:sensor histidine kinase [Chlorobiales bacterium]